MEYAAFVSRSLDLKNNPGDFKRHDHICHFYSSIKEKFSVVAEYIESGLKLGDRCLYVVDKENYGRAVEELERAGIEVETAMSGGGLSLIENREMYLNQGKFDPDYIIREVKRFCDIARSRGYGNLRIASDMTRSGDDRAELYKLMEYEAKLNIFSRNNNFISLCQYRLNRFEPRWVQKVIQTHPKIILKNVSCENGYYVPPSEFLQDDNALYGVRRMLRRILKRKKLENRISNGTFPANLNDQLMKRQMSEWEKTLKVFQESESYFRKIVNAVPVAVLMTDTGGRCLYANEHWNVLSGLNLQESIGQGWQKAIHPEDVGAIGPWWYRGEKKRTDPGTECRVRSAGGDTRWVDLKSAPLLDESSDLIGYIVTFSDITHYK